jgi:ABC-type nitrate/sulfonate/bicarbonate transport system ATPase subunit
VAALSLEIREKRFPPVGEAPAKLVLKQLRLAVEPGETVALIGPSGCGKTTLLNIVAGLDSDFSGRLELAPNTRIAYVFQEPRLLPWRTVEDNLRLVLDGVPALDGRIAAALAEVGLEGAGKVFASRLSLGMARRVALARAFVIRPDLLLLDEPFVSLDEPTAHRLRLLLLDLLAAHGTTAIFVTHNLREAIMIAHRLLFLSASPAHVVTQAGVPLGREERGNEAAIEACRSRLLAAQGPLSGSRLHDIAASQPAEPLP